MNINKTHLDEWVLNSAVLQEIANLNVQSINKVEGYSPSSLLFDLLHPNPKRTNSGRLDASGLRQFDNCLETSGWWVSGIDPFTWELMEWGRFKPDPDTPLSQAYFNHKLGKEEKPKYRSPAGIASRLVLLRITDRLWEKVSQRYGVPISAEEKQHPGGFWHWVWAHPEIPIIIVEGEKKAGCLLSLGYVAIPLPGIWMGRRWDDNVTKINESLIPDLALFAQAGRPVKIIFDDDPKLKTKVQVYKAIISTAKLLDKAGCKVQVGILPSMANGKNAVDDFVVAGGDIAAVIDGAIAWENYKNNHHPCHWKQPSTEEREKAESEQFAKWVLKRAEKLRAWWKNQRKFTPTITQNQKYTEYKGDIKKGTVLGIKAGTGTGKTTFLENQFRSPKIDRIKELFEEGGLFYHEGAIMIGARNGLLLQNAARLGFNHLQNEKCFNLLHEPKSKIALCIDSLPHYLDPKWFDGKIVILDETMETVRHLEHSKTLNKNRSQCQKMWGECLKRGQNIVCLDAHLADWVIDEFILKFTGYREVIKFENQYKGDRAPVEFLIGTPTKKTQLPENINKGLKKKGLNSRDISPFIPMIISAKTPFIAVDSQRVAEALEVILVSLGYKGLRVDAKTVADKHGEAKKFMLAPDDWIKANLPEFIIVSPTVQSGVDINIKDYFTDVYALYFGVVSSNAQLQMPGRVRDPNVQWHVSCPEYTRKDGENFSNPDVKQLQKCLIDYLLQDPATLTTNLPFLFDVIKGKVEALQENPHFHAWAKLKAIENYEKANLRDCLIEVLKEAGHEIKFVEMQHDDGGSELLKEAKETVLRKEASEIFNAPDIDPCKVQELQANFDATWEDRCKVIKAGYKDRLPGIENTPFWTEELIYLFRKNRNFISQSELYYFLYNPEYLQEQQQELWAYIALGGVKFLPDIRSRHLKIKALEKLGIKEILESGKAYSNKSPEILKMLALARKSKKMSAALGIVPGKCPIKYLKRVLGLVGYGLVGKKSNGSWSYQVIQDMGEIRDSLVQCLEQKYNPQCFQEQKSSKWEEVKIAFSVQKINPLSEVSQTLTTTELSVREDCPNVLSHQGQSSLDEIATLPEAPDLLTEDFSEELKFIPLNHLVRYFSSTGEVIGRYLGKIKDSVDEILLEFGEGVRAIVSPRYCLAVKGI